MVPVLIRECARSVVREFEAGRKVDPSRLEWARKTLAGEQQ